MLGVLCMKEIYYIHPIVNNHIWITVKRHYKGRDKMFPVFQIDLPGRWYEDEYNVHVDGCDYQCATLEEALHRGAYYYHGDRQEEYEFANSEELYDIFQG